VTEFLIAFLVYVCILTGLLIGVYLHRVMPPDHMKDDTRQIVNVAIGLVATLAALVLGLMVASVKTSFDARAEEVRESASRIILLDRTLRQYGPETRETRMLLGQLVEARVKSVWGREEDSGSTQAAAIESIRSRLFALAPGSEAQKWLYARALTVAADLEQARWMLLEQSRSSIPRPFLVVLVFWLVVIFATLGLFAPRNATAYTIILICAFSVATAIFLILEMDQPYEGLLQISDAPLRNALSEIAR